MAKELALIGRQLIHTYPYVVHFNGSDRERIAKNAKPWMQRFMLDRDLSPTTSEVRVTRIWSPDAEEAKRLAETFDIPRICATADEALDGADGAMVMDEVIESRTALVENALERGISVFADKVLSADPQKTCELIELAERKGCRVRSWSQLYFLPALAPVRQAGGGGVGFLDYQMEMKILPMYGIHPVSMLQGAFSSPAKSYRPLLEGNGRGGLVELEDGTRIFVYVGADVPFRGRLYYETKDSALRADEPDDWACFERAAKALVELFSGRSPAPGPGPEEMRQAARFLEILIQGGSDGRVVPLGG